MIWRLLALFLALATLSAGPVAEAAPVGVAQGSVTKIEIVGNERIEEATVLAAISLRRGDTLTRGRARQVVKAVYRTGFFDDVRIRVEPDGDGVKVVIEVDEKPAISDVLLAGNKKINEEDIREVIDIRNFSVLNDAEVKRNVDRIRDLYVEKGYYLVEVDPEVVYIEDDQVELTFRITENRKVVVQTVDFVGNENVPTSKFRRFLQVKPGGVLPWLSGGGTFQREKLDMDREAIRYVLWEEGYLDSTVAAPKVFLSPDKRYIYVSHQIDEGQRYDFGFVALEGDFIEEEGLTEDVIREIVEGTPVNVIQERQWRQANDKGTRDKAAWLESKSAQIERGEPFKASTMQAVAGAIESLYQDQGYAFVNVTPYPYPNPRTGEADIIIRIETGGKYKIGKINITGNDPTFDKVIRREIQVDEGDVYRGGRLQASRARIQRLGFFENVDFSTPRGKGEDVLDINVGVTERPTGSFSLGLGFSNLESFVLTGSISKNNFLGLGYIMSASINWSRIRQQFQLQFYDPYFLDSRYTMRLNAYNINQSFIQGLDEYQRGGSLEFGRYIDQRDEMRVSLSYTFEDVGLNSLDTYRQQLLGGDLYRNGLTSTVGLNFNVDKRNNRIRPTQGVYMSASASLSGGFRVGPNQVLNLLGGQFNFAEIRGNVRVYQPLIKDSDWLVFRMNTTLGYVHSTDGNVIPFIHRYRAGGINSVRGYQWFSLGPTLRGLGSDDPSSVDASLAVGGTQTWINNFEIESPIVRQAGISLALFFDAGNAFGDPFGEGFINPAKLRFAFGGELRWLSPIGPLRFAYGIPIRPREGERKTVFDFSIGSFF